MKNVRTMTILVNAEDENDITILSDNLGGSVTFCENEVEFLRKVLKNREEHSQKLASDFSKGQDSFF